MKGTVCAKGQRCEQENSSGSMMLESVEMGGEATKMDCAGCAKMFELSPVGNGNFWWMLRREGHDQSHRVIHLSSQSLLQCKAPLLS